MGSSGYGWQSGNTHLLEWVLVYISSCLLYLSTFWGKLFTSLLSINANYWYLQLFHINLGTVFPHLNFKHTVTAKNVLFSCRAEKICWENCWKSQCFSQRFLHCLISEPFGWVITQVGIKSRYWPHSNVFLLYFWSFLRHRIPKVKLVKISRYSWTSTHSQCTDSGYTALVNGAISEFLLVQVVGATSKHMAWLR